MRKVLFIALLLMVVMMTGCWRDYDVPEFIDIGPNESAFLLPKTGNLEKQAQFSSEEYLKKNMVTVKRVQITHIWQNTGRWDYDGKWVPDVLLIKVNRQPVNREWTTDATTGTDKRDQGIWAESRDSVGFSTGIVISAMIDEKDAALFLYKYRSGDLTAVMDTEIRVRVQTVFSDTAAEYDMSDLRAKKAEIIKAVREDVVPFFKSRGITISTIGMTGGFKYENKQIQEGIDKVFLAQREKEISAAQLAAQADKNTRMGKEAEAIANKELQIAKAKAEAQEMLIAVAEKAAKSTMFLKLRELEIKAKMIEKWDGAFPRMILGGGNGMMMNMSLDDIVAKDKPLVAEK